MVPRARHSQVPATSVPGEAGPSLPTDTPHRGNPASQVWLPGAATTQSPPAMGAARLGLQVEGEQGL